MATEKERQEFVARFVAEYNGKHNPHPRNSDPGAHGGPGVLTLQECIDAARSLLRHARTHGRLAVDECNGPSAFIDQVPYPRAGELIAEWEARLEKRQAACEKRIREICAGFNLPVHLGGDPRGYTVKVKLPSGAHNTWGGSEEGYGVPQ